MTWRDSLAPLIARTIQQAGRSDPKALRKALRSAWDKAGLGERKHWPYKVWLDEIHAQLGRPGGLARYHDRRTRDLFDDTM